MAINVNNGQMVERKPKTLVESVSAWAEVHKADIEGLIPKGAISGNRFIQAALFEVANDTKLQACDYLSVIKSIKTCAVWGLEPGGLQDLCYLIPYGKECRVQLGYKGIIALARRTGDIRDVTAETVYENDTCDIEGGDFPKITHKFALQNRGEAIGYYVIATLANGEKHRAYMSKEDVIKHRDNWSIAKSSSAWIKSFDEMAKKTVIIRCLKLCPMSAEVAEALSYDEKVEAEVEPMPANHTAELKEDVAKKQRVQKSKVAEAEVVDVAEEKATPAPTQRQAEVVPQKAAPQQSIKQEATQQSAQVASEPMSDEELFGNPY